LAKSEIYLNFGTHARVSGNGGCNQYTGSYQSSGDRLTVSTLATTFKLCRTPDGVMKQEAQYLDALSKAARFEIAGDTLTIRDRGGAMQVVAKANLPAGLAGTSWSITNINNGQEAVIGTIAGTKLTVKFEQGNRVAGTAGCNTFSGPYESSGKSLTIGPLAATRRTCASPRGVLQQERQFLTALQEAATFELNGHSLTIRDATGAMQVIASAE
jgi:heat shock protein HslJ